MFVVHAKITRKEEKLFSQVIIIFFTHNNGDVDNNDDADDNYIHINLLYLMRKMSTSSTTQFDGIRPIRFLYRCIG